MSTRGSSFVSEILRSKFQKDHYVLSTQIGDGCEESGYASGPQERHSMRSRCVVFYAKYHLVKAEPQACCQDPGGVTLT